MLSTLDFSAEGEQTPEGIQATFEETMRSIDFAKGNGNLAYAVFKPSTITTDELLAKASEKRSELTIEEVKAFREFKERFMAFCQRAYENDVRLIVDAPRFQLAAEVLPCWVKCAGRSTFLLFSEASPTGNPDHSRGE